MTGELTPRARQILAAVEREIEARRLRRPAPLAAGPGALDSALLLALELGVAGQEREAVARRLGDEHGIDAPGPLLDAVFGPGTEPRARLRRSSG